MEVLLNTSYRHWYKGIESYSIGYAFVKGEMLEGERLCNYLYGKIEQNSLNESLQELNGFFAVILNYHQNYYLIADSIRSYPLLYGSKGAKTFIADSAEKLAVYFEEEQMNELAVAEFLALGYLSEGRSLYENIKNIEAGSYVIFSATDCQVIVYHQNIFPKQQEKNDKQLILKSKYVMEQAFKRMLETCGDRQIVLPLSGGYDSRLLACLCKKFNVKNVICFTYGKRDSFEVATSKKVADKLGFDWYFVEYTDQIWLDVCDSLIYKEYEMFAGNLNAVPVIQEFPAIYKLKKDKVIEENAIVIPGHSADLLGGSHLPVQSDIEPLYRFIYKKYFRLNKLKPEYETLVLKSLKSTVGDLNYNQDIESYLNIFNDWGIKVRQANFIVNSVRVYEYFGLDWRLPLWDKEFATFWNSISWVKKYNSVLFHRFLFECYFKSFKVNFLKENRLRINIRKYIRPLFANRYGLVCYRMINKIRKKGKTSDINLFSVVSDFIYKKNTFPKELVEVHSNEVNAPLAIKYWNIVNHINLNSNDEKIH